MVGWRSPLLPAVSKTTHAASAPMSSVRVQSYFFLFGFAVLLPWNCLLSVMEFMNISVFPGRGWTLLVSPLYNSTSLATQALMLFAGQFFTTWKLICISLPFGMLCSAVLLAALNPLILTNDARFWGAVMSCVGLGFGMSGLLQTSSGELSARLLSKHGPLLAHYSNGMAAAGVVTFIVASVLSAIGSEEIAAKGLFMLSGFTMVACAAALRDLVRSGTVRFSEEAESGFWQVLANEADVVVSPLDTPRLLASPCSTRSRAESVCTISTTESLRRVGVGVARAWAQEVNLIIIYVQTFLVFPAVCLMWVPHDRWTSPATYGLIMVSIYQGFDLIGRLCCTATSVIRLLPPGNRLWILILLRTIVLPFFFMSWLSPVMPFSNFSFQATLVAILAASNGALTNLAFTSGAQNAPLTDSDIVGRSLPLCIGIGIVIGSMVSSSTISFALTTATSNHMLV